MNEQQMKTLHQKIDAGVKEAIASSIEQHRQLGQSISIWLDGIVTLKAEEIPPKDTNTSQKSSFLS